MAQVPYGRGTRSTPTSTSTYEYKPLVPKERIKPLPSPGSTFNTKPSTTQKYGGAGAARYPQSGMTTTSANSKSNSGQSLLSTGSRRNSVAQAQRILGIPDDGIFGPQTRAAVIDFQQRNGLKVDGIIGPQTWSALNRSSSSVSNKSPSRTNNSDASKLSNAVNASNQQPPAQPSNASVPSSPTDDQYTQLTPETFQEQLGIAEQIYGPLYESRNQALQRNLDRIATQAEQQRRMADVAFQEAQQGLQSNERDAWNRMMRSMSNRGLETSGLTSYEQGQLAEQYAPQYQTLQTNQAATLSNIADNAALATEELAAQGRDLEANFASQLAQAAANQIYRQQEVQQTLDDLALRQFNTLAPYQYLTEVQRQNLPLDWTQVIGEVPASVPGGGTSSSGASNRPMLRQGSRGSNVRQLQESLKNAGFDPGSIDGIFGPGTRQAVTNFQRARGLSVDGIVGPQTWAALGG